MDKNKLFVSILSNLEIKNKRRLTPDEKLFLKNRWVQVNINELRGNPIDKVISVMTDVFSKELSNLPKNLTEGAIDIHETLVRAIGPDSETNLIDRRIKSTDTLDGLLQIPNALLSVVNPSALLRTTYLVLDRKYQSSDANNTTEFSWNIASIDAGYDASSTAVTSKPMKDICSIKLLPFKFPNNDRELSFRNNLSVEIVECNTQSYIIAKLNKRFHFILNLIKNSSGQQYDITDLGNSLSQFYFHDPIIELNTLTVRFGNPDLLLHLDIDSLYGIFTSVGVQTVITFTQPHGCVISDGITVTGFTTNQPISDAILINSINSLYGWPITAVTTNTITINIDLTGLTGIIPATSFYVYLESKRFTLRLEVSYLMSRS